jgi:prolyl-tRNA editing enzyme YbaK/EbsC (Cys-tRNA(Pro) deacylase)
VDHQLTEVDLAVRRRLDELEVKYEMVPCDPDLADTAVFCETYGYSTGDSANTIVVQSRDTPPRFVACVLLATTRLDVNGLVRRRLGRKCSFASAENVVSLTGMTLGGVTPVGLPDGLPLWIDSRVLERERVLLGGGSRHWKLIAAPGFLATLPGAEVVEDLAVESPPPPSG